MDYIHNTTDDKNIKVSKMPLMFVPSSCHFHEGDVLVRTLRELYC